MTATKDVKLDNGIEVKDAIHRVETVSIGYNGEMKYTVRVYADLSLPSFYEFSKACVYGGGGAISECYENLIADGDYMIRGTQNHS